jgi:hypothetical protein
MLRTTAPAYSVIKQTNTARAPTQLVNRATENTATMKPFRSISVFRPQSTFQGKQQ